MIIIGKETYVIEAKLPLSFSNKLQDSDEGPVVVPDGPTKYEYQWFCGVGLNPYYLAKGVQLPMNIWSPYPEQAFQYKDKEDAEAVNKYILGESGGGSVLPWSKCHKAMGRQIIVPVGDIVLSKPNKDGRGS